ncbi:hypothetical protein BC941DRAFT_129017 [Chlamydoabsidia padenii]|nr:hypothetical protein BC941DRAFT_129017 [Chlamydoabsidia padenii]
MIMFGVNSRHELLQDLHVLNMTNVTSPTWLGAPVPSPISDNINSGPSELSPGAIAGIVVGAVVASIALTAALIYMMYRKRKQRKEFELEKTDPRRMSLTESMILTDKQQEDYYNGSKLQSPTIQRYSIPATRTVINGVTTTISNDHSVYSSSSPISPAFNEPIKPFFPGEESNRVKPDGDC